MEEAAILTSASRVSRCVMVPSQSKIQCIGWAGLGGALAAIVVAGLTSERGKELERKDGWDLQARDRNLDIRKDPTR